MALDEQYESVNHPKHYTSHPSGIECIEITEHFGFCVGNAFKYVWRCGLKPGQDAIQELDKSIWYLERRATFVRANSIVPVVLNPRVLDKIQKVIPFYSGEIGNSMLAMYNAEIAPGGQQADNAIKRAVLYISREKKLLLENEVSRSQRIVDNSEEHY